MVYVAKKAYKISEKEKGKLISIISKVLKADQKVIFAYLFGSFVSNDVFNDIDIFIFFPESENYFLYLSNLREELYDAMIKAGINRYSIDDFDLKAINDAPYDFAMDILCNGMLIIDKEPDIRMDYIEHISDEYRVNSFIIDEVFM